VEWALLHLSAPFAHFGATRDSALGLAVPLLVIFVCLPLVPVYAWQVRATSRLLVEQAQVAPRMEERRRQFVRDPQRFQ
jgi:membrane protein insertase Oxa1/YidC/SpoIIIJ